MQRGYSIFKQFLSLFILFSLTFSTFAQTKKTAPKTTAKQTCNGGWNGVVSFRKTLKKSRDYGKKKNIARGTTHNKYSRDYEYAGKLFVNEYDKMTFTKARVALKDKEADWKRYEQTEDCAGDRVDRQQVQWSETETESVKDAFGEDEAEFNFYVDEQGGIYNFGFRFPEANGTENRIDKVTKGGWCSARLNEGSDNSNKNPLTIEGEGFNLEEGKINPKTPNVISGSKTWETGTPDSSGFKYEVSWTFKRCGSLIITEVELFQPVYPSYNNWTKIEKGNYTIDGNFVKVVAKIANISGTAKTTPIEFRELKENTILPEGKLPITIEPNQEKEIVYLWDTSGYAWKDAGVSEINRQIEVKITDDAKTENVEVRPKPVIVIPGLWTDKNAFSSFLSYFENQKSARWKVDYARVIASKSAAENAPEVAQRIKEVQELTNAWHVDLVGHSTGGLIGRVYVNSLMGQLADGKPTVTNLVMIGTPNNGTPCSIGVDNIFTRFFNKSGDAFREVTPKNMRDFNRQITANNGTKFYALAGEGFEKTCQSNTPGDGLVPKSSAIWQIKNFKNIFLTSTHEFSLRESSVTEAVHNRLAVSPKGNHQPDENLTGNLNSETTEENFAKRRNYGASFYQPNIQTTDDEELEPAFLTGVKLSPHQSTEIEIPVTDGKRMAVNLLMPKKVSATLTESNGTVAGKNLAGTSEASATFRIIRVDKPIQKGVWKLKLDSQETEEAEITVVVFTFDK